MKTLNSLIVASLLLASCGGADSENENSLINGKWASSLCLRLDLPFTEYNSFKNVMDIKNGSISNKLYQYTDTQCSNLGAIIDNGLFAGLYEKYNIGSTVTLEDGNTVKEIDFFDKHGNLLPDIYLSSNSGDTLYFGVKEITHMDPCPLNKGEISSKVETGDGVYFGDDGSCWTWTSRPVEINYNEAFTIIDE